MKIVFKRCHRTQNKYPLLDRDTFLKNTKDVKCSLFLLDFSWMEDKEVCKVHRLYDVSFPQNANGFTNQEIRVGLKQLVELGYLKEKIL